MLSAIQRVQIVESFVKSIPKKTFAIKCLLGEISLYLKIVLNIEHYNSKQVTVESGVPAENQLSGCKIKFMLYIHR